MEPVRNREDLYDLIRNTETFFLFLQSLGLLRDNFFCKKCKKNMIMKRLSGGDGMIFKCYGRKCNKRTISVRSGSVFEGFKSSLKTIILVFYEIVQKTPIKQIKKELLVDSRTISKILKILKPLMKTVQNIRIGGKNSWVEVDETAVSRRKYNVGRIKKQLWIVGGVDRESKKMFFALTEKRDGNFLKNTLLKHVDQNSTVVTDCWRGYNKIKKDFFEVYSINHSRNFVDPKNNQIHTQTIESSWRWVKEYLKTRKPKGKKSIYKVISQYFYFRSKKFNFYEILSDISSLSPFKRFKSTD